MGDERVEHWKDCRIVSAFVYFTPHHISHSGDAELCHSSSARPYPLSLAYSILVQKASARLKAIALSTSSFLKPGALPKQAPPSTIRARNFSTSIVTF
jgi:hypothetical protein